MKKNGKVTWEHAKGLDEDYALILNTEKHGYQLVMVDGVLRWEQDPLIDEMFHRRYFCLNDIFAGACKPLVGIEPKIKPNKHLKNDPIIRELYRRLGYSLFGYWETFYWEANNEYWEEYKE